MACNGSPSLHAILEELPNEDDLASSEGELQLSHPNGMQHSNLCRRRRKPRHFRSYQWCRRGLPCLNRTLDPSLSNRQLNRRSDNAPYRTTLNTKSHSDGASSSTSGWPLRQDWLTCINVNRRLRQTAPWRLIMRSGNSPPLPRLARTWQLQPHFWIHCSHPPLLGWARCTSG
jgi:hypothetical protein